MDLTQHTSKKQWALRLRLLLWSLGSASFIVVTTSLVFFLGVGKWLVREDPLQPATAIAVLSGNIPDRALEAAQLYREGYAKEIWLTHPGEHADALKMLGISYPSEDDFNQRVLRGQGVPAKAIHVLDTPIVNTAEELDAISAALKKRGGEKVIVVTNQAHTRRVHILWNKYFGSRGQLIVHGLPDDDFQAAHWWKNSGDMAQVTHEILGIMNAWAGLPVQSTPHPASQVVAAGPGSTVSPEHTSVD